METPTLEALIFGTNRRATFLRACFFGRIIDAVHFFIISATLPFRRDHRNGTIVLHAFPAGSSRSWLGAKSKICLLLSCFHGLWREAQCVIVRTLRAQA